MPRLSVVISLLLLPMSASAAVIQHHGQDLQKTLDDAPAHAVIHCDRGERLVVSETIQVRKPVTIHGLNAGLPDSLGKTSILRVTSEGFAITDFELYGNASSVDQAVRAPLITIERGGFRVERGLFVNSSKDGVEINTTTGGGDIVGGIVRDVVGRGVVRDVVSISGSGRTDGLKVRNVLVENVRGYDSRLRGPVEVSDGAENITVRTVYAERCAYAVDVQDHNKPSQINRNIVIEDVYAVDCRYAIRTANRPFGHVNLTIRDVVAERCTEPLRISNTSGLTVTNVRITGHTGEKPAVSLRWCDQVDLRDVSVAGKGSAEAVMIEDSGRLVVDGLKLVGNLSSYTNGLIYRVKADSVFEDVTIRNVRASGTSGTGILLEKTHAAASLSDYVLEGNVGDVHDGFGQ